MRLQLLRINSRRLHKWNKIIRITLYVFSISIVIALIFMLVVWNKDDYVPYYSMITSVLFGVAMLTQLIAMLKIYYLLLKNYQGDLEGEKRWLLISQSIFAFSFFLRSILIVLVLYGHWVAFVRDYPVQS